MNMNDIAPCRRGAALFELSPRRGRRGYQWGGVTYDDYNLTPLRGEQNKTMGEGFTEVWCLDILFIWNWKMEHWK